MFGWGLRRERAFGTVTVMPRTYVRRRRLVLSLLVTGIAIVCLRASPGSAEPGRPPILSATHTTRYVIRPGDTLWSIARRLDPSEDPRRVVDAIVVRNGIDPAHLVPGQAIVISNV
jgi:nucleoid-associated protein YgaU